MTGEIHILLVIGSAIIISFFGGKLVNRFRLPMVTGYVIVGVILGRSFLNIITPEIAERASIFNDLALGIIALLIGGEFHRSRIRALGKTIVYIATFESLFAFLLVAGTVFLFTRKIYSALILGAVASATAPAATVAVINQYRARGPLTTTIMGVVGSDDAIALMIYSFASSVARSFLEHVKLTIHTVLVAPLTEITLSLVLGAVLGYLLGLGIKKTRNRAEAFTLVMGALLIGEGIATQFHLSELLTIMAMGMMAVNIAPLRRFSQVMETVNIAGFPIIAAFFCLAGTKLNIRLLPQIGLLGLAYTAARMAGKWSGASLGAKISGASEKVRKYVGLSLFPQIGVAIALAIVVQKEFGRAGIQGQNLALLVINILLFTTIITEVVGPNLTRIILTKAGEIRKK
ncbi:MAG: cation:proton antiporter [Caldiserica bacterium]|nr:cation:proton antiporter [Caldisericota bacterium]